MDRQLDMVVNRLPQPTWNRLNMNETKLAGMSIPAEAVYNIQTASNTTVRKLEKDAAADITPDRWNEIETGMGEDVTGLGQEITPNLFTVFSDSGITLVTIEENGSDTFCSFLIHANKGTDSHFAFVCKSKESGSQATGGTLTVQVKILAEENATVHISCIQALNGQAMGIFNIGGTCEKNARIELTRLELGAAKQYTGCCIGLDGDSSSFGADIGYMENGSRLLDMNYIARHRGRHTKSDMNVTGVLRDNAFKIFRGSIDFISGCSGAKGNEQEDVLMLGDDVVNQTVPLILCAEEDVEGNHGATIGEIDERTLFYLASRGIAREEAEQLISHARIESVSNLLPPQLRELVTDY